ncbi:hypothetical protein, partial [Arthrobacter sp. ZBG10]
RRDPAAAPPRRTRLVADMTMLGTRPVKTATGRGRREDWSQLTGRTVEVWMQGEHIATGIVDQAADDDSVLWIAGAGADTRRLFDKFSGYQIWA